mmetsp:Transcript_51529/g.81761  ORF Transcript_51529/g.81761 Transcript_51529/m.81761 type:complete len:197 (+) Transcript_51529:48-638(+)
MSLSRAALWLVISCVVELALSTAKPVLTRREPVASSSGVTKEATEVVSHEDVANKQPEKEAVNSATSSKTDLVAANSETKKSEKKQRPPIKMYVLGDELPSPAELELERKSELKKKAARAWENEVNPDVHNASWWPWDHLDEKRVDMADHKIYTWRQYRMKHSFTHSWNLVGPWKRLPTLERIKKYGKKAFIMRTR